MYKKILSLVLAITTLSLVSCGNTGDKKDKFTVAIGQFAEHASLDNCRLGFIEGLKKSGFIEGNNLEILYENAAADTSLSNQICDNFVSNKVDLICAIATPIAQAAYASTKKTDIPVIFTAVTDPKLAGLTNSSDRKITGTSDKLPIRKQLEMIKTLLPEIKKIGILYSTSEVNSERSIEEYQNLAPEYGFDIILAPVTSASDIPLATDRLIKEVDCINNITDNTVVNSLEIILERAAKANKPVFGSEIEQVKLGCLAAAGLDYFNLGIETGKIAGKVLNGEDASKIDFITMTEANLYGNEEVASMFGITLPDNFIKVNN